jgi:hypothetical protein
MASADTAHFGLGEHETCPVDILLACNCLQAGGQPAQILLIRNQWRPGHLRPCHQLCNDQPGEVNMS